MRTFFAHIFLLIALLHIARGQNIRTPHPSNFSQAPLMLDEGLTATILSNEQLETFSDQATQQVLNFFEYARYAQDEAVDTALRRHAQNLLLQNLDAKFSLVFGQKSYPALQLFPVAGAQKLRISPGPIHLHGWKGTWKSYRQGIFERSLHISAPMTLNKLSLEGVSCLLRLEKIEKQFGDETLEVWEIRLLNIQVRER